MKLPILTPERDIHTSDLTEKCHRKVALRWAGKSTGAAQTAMVRGLIAGRAIELHLNDGEDLETCAASAARDVVDSLAEEGRTMSDAATRDLGDIAAEITAAIVPGWPRVMAELAGGRKLTFVGSELPVRGVIDVDGQPQSLASHIDLLFKRNDGVFVCADLKWREDAPTFAYLNRNLQLAMYWHLLGSQAVRFPDGRWYQLGSQPLVCWVHLPGLKPAGRKQDYTDTDTGEVITLQKGDERPIRAAVKWCAFHRATEHAVIEEIRTRIRMYRAGLFPITPEPVSCITCECEPWCTRFDLPATATE